VIVEVVPEEIIWEYLGQKLGGRPAEPLPQQKYFAQLPERIEFSEEFVARWRQTVGVAVRRAVRDALRLRSFLILERDQVRRVTIAEPAFWQDVTLAFSEEAAQAVWQLVLTPATHKDPAIDRLTPADALLVAIVHRSYFHRVPFDWLLAKQANWVIPAVFAQHQVMVDPGALPWETVFQKPERVPLPLREFFIEKTAEFFRVATDAVNHWVAGVAPVPEPHEAAGPGGRAAMWAAPEFHPLKQYRFKFENILEVLRLQRRCGPWTEAVRAALAYWTGEGTLGLDDDRYITGAAQQFGLLDAVSGFTTAVQAVFDVASESDLTLARSNP